MTGTIDTMTPERAIAFMIAFKTEYGHKDVDAACDLAISCIERYRDSWDYKFEKKRKEKRNGTKR